MLRFAGATVAATLAIDHLDLNLVRYHLISPDTN